MTNDLFGSLFELQDSRLDKLGNPLLALEENHRLEHFSQDTKSSEQETE